MLPRFFLCFLSAFFFPPICLGNVFLEAHVSLLCAELGCILFSFPTLYLIFVKTREHAKLNTRAFITCAQRLQLMLIITLR